MSPYVLLGLFIAGLLKVFVPDKWVVRAAGSRGIEVPPLMSLAGVPLPLCSCSVLPFAMGLRKQGASPGAVVSFLTSTPQTGVDSILVAYGFFGLPFALFKTAVAFVSGTLAGWFSNWFGGSGDAVEGRSVESAEVCTEGECCSGSASCDPASLPFFIYLRHRIGPDSVCPYACGHTPRGCYGTSRCRPCNQFYNPWSGREIPGEKRTVIYVLTVIVTALLVGFLFDRLFTLDLGVSGWGGE